MCFVFFIVSFFLRFSLLRGDRSHVAITFSVSLVSALSDRRVESRSSDWWCDRWWSCGGCGCGSPHFLVIWLLVFFRCSWCGCSFDCDFVRSAIVGGGSLPCCAMDGPSRDGDGETAWIRRVLLLCEHSKVSSDRSSSLSRTPKHQENN